MSFDTIPTAVLANHLAPFFRFESSVDPARADEIGHDGHRLLRLRKFTPAQRALVIRKMDRVHTVHLGPADRTECSSVGYIHLFDKRSTNMFVPLTQRWVRMHQDPYTIVAWNGNHWEPRDHPILLRPAPASWHPRLSFGKTI